MAPAVEPHSEVPGDAVSRGYIIAQQWEHSAEISNLQAHAVGLVAACAAERPLPRHLQEEVEEQPGPDAEAQELILQNSHQLYKWHSQLETAMSCETEGKYLQYAQALKGHVSTCDQILSQVEAALGSLDALQSQHRAVDAKTRSLHDACERLVTEKQRLMDFAEALCHKLHYFDELTHIAAAFHTGSLAVGGEHFLPLLKRLDECIAYVNSNLHYADASSFALKFRQLHSRAMGSVRTHVVNVLRRASAKVQSSMQEGGGGGSGNLAEGAETSVLYVRFRAAAPELRPLMEEMESRASRREYHQLLSDCHLLYCEQRLALVGAVVQDRLLEYCNDQPLTTMTRSGCAYLMQVCQLEQELFEHFFPGVAGGVEAALSALLDPLCTVLYDLLRPQFVVLTSLDTLCELVDILKLEVLEDQLGRRRQAAAGLKPTAQRILADVQERLIFRAQTYIQDEVMAYQPSDADVDYPGKLERAAQETASTPEEDADGTSEDNQYSTWFPPLEKTLSCLSKLYRCVDASIFAGLAQEAVATCSESVSIARRMVQRRAGPLDGMLFLIKHLLILREQIAPFNTELAVVQKELDFTHMREHMRRIMRGETSLLTLNANNAFVSLVTQGGPRIMESQVDSKKDLERQLKQVCEEFIMTVTKMTVEPMLSFITKVTAVKVTGGRGSEAKSLRDQAFASPAKLTEIVNAVNTAMEGPLPMAANKMKLYLLNPSTRAILFKPIKSNIAEAHGQIAQLLDTEYTPDDVISIQLLGAEELSAKLESLC